MDSKPPETELNLENAPTSTKRWDYATFKEYLLSQARGKDFLLPITEFPSEIDLSTEWHSVLNVMREKTSKDQIERVGLAGYNLAQDHYICPQKESQKCLGSGKKIIMLLNEQ